MGKESWDIEIGECTHPHSGDGPCDDCVQRSAVLPTLREIVPQKEIGYVEKLRAFDERFKQHPWWKRCIDGTPLSNDLPVIAVEVFNSLISKPPVNYEDYLRHVATLKS